MNTSQRLSEMVRDSIRIKEKLVQDAETMNAIGAVIDVVTAAFQRGNKVLFAGNGGSAADAQHLAAEFVSRFEFDRPGLPSISLATDTSMITAIGNDYGYEMLFRRQLQAQGRSGDVFIGITTSGKSPNILRAFETCPEIGVTSVALCGLGGDLESVAHHVIRAPSAHTPRIQECHTLIGHMICAEVEQRIFGHLRKDPQ